MLARAGSVAILGAEAHLVDVEVHSGDGLPAFKIVGLPAVSVKEAEQRVRAALAQSGERWPPGRVVANLAPASLRKDGAHFDLALAVGIVTSRERIPAAALEGWVFMGELGLDGTLRSVPGVLAAAIASRERGMRGVVCPADNGGEAAVVDGIEVVPVADLRECIGFLRGKLTVERPQPAAPDEPGACDDMAEVRGQSAAKTALEIAAAGGHNLLMLGSPGSGKTMLARRLPGILPPMSPAESLEATKVHSVAGLLGPHHGLLRRRPFRAPHHNISMAGLIGGGSGLARPGELSLAHHGVLFLDELTLHRPANLDALRGPLEEGVVRVARSGGVVTFPCRISLIAAANPCPCGYRDDPRRGCRCSDHLVSLYRARLSGPLIDRFDMCITMPRLTRTELMGTGHGEPSTAVRARVCSARRAQTARYGSELVTNASAPLDAIRATLAVGSATLDHLGRAIDDLSLSGRGLARVLRVARTIADLDGSDPIRDDHAMHALMLRMQDWTAEVAS